MEQLTQLFFAAIYNLISHINWYVFVLVIAAGYFAKTWLSDINISLTIKTLAMGFIFTLLYAIISYLAGNFDRSAWQDFFTTYVAATSFYELILRDGIPFIARILKLNKNETK